MALYLCALARAALLLASASCRFLSAIWAAKAAIAADAVAPQRILGSGAWGFEVAAVLFV